MDDVESVDERRGFTFVEHVGEAGALVPLEIAHRCDREREQPVVGQLLDHLREQIALQIVHDQHQIPRSCGWFIGREVGVHEGDVDVRLGGPLLGDGDRYLRRVDHCCVPPAFCEPDGVATRPAGEIEGATGRGEQRRDLNSDECGGIHRGRPLPVSGVPR